MNIDSIGNLFSTGITIPFTLYQYAPQYVGNTLTTFNVKNTNFPGEWIQIKFPSIIDITQYKIACVTGSSSSSATNRNATSFALVGSIDGINWYLIDQRDNVFYSDQTSNVYSVSASYSHFRLIATQLVNNEWALSQLVFFDGSGTSYPPLLSSDTVSLNGGTYLCTSSVPYLFFYDSDTHPISSIMGSTNYTKWIDIFLNMPSGYQSNYLGSTVTMVN
jgi:hypothetical protein